MKDFLQYFETYRVELNGNYYLSKEAFDKYEAENIVKRTEYDIITFLQDLGVDYATFKVSRRIDIVEVRYAVAYVLNESNYLLREIGEKLFRDYSTVHYLLNHYQLSNVHRIEELISKFKKYKI